ncbi:hypothetical protein MJT46_015377 [Ovis ammon polii x Ovis aries]|nr:hypothetical protein MJT46_015377 [Ovis ammon polii x Ovis aries]
MNRKVPEELCVFFLRDIRCPVTCADFDTSVEKDRCNHFHTSERRAAGLERACSEIMLCCDRKSAVSAIGSLSCLCWSLRALSTERLKPLP